MSIWKVEGKDEFKAESFQIFGMLVGGSVVGLGAWWLIGYDSTFECILGFVVGGVVGYLVGTFLYKKLAVFFRG